QIGNDAFKRMLAVIARAVFIEIGKHDFLVAGPVQDDFLDVRRQLFEWRVQVEVVVTGKAGQQLIIELVAPVPSLDRTGSQRQVCKDNHSLGIEKRDISQPDATRTGTDGIVEGKQ